MFIRPCDRTSSYISSPNVAILLSYVEGQLLERPIERSEDANTKIMATIKEQI